VTNFLHFELYLWIEQDDLALVERCLGGDNRAFEGIVEKYQKPVFNAVFRIVNDYDDSEDVTQAAFVKAYEKLRSFNRKYKFFSWLYRIAVNESINFVNSRKNLEELNESLMSNEKTPDETSDRIDLSERIRDALLDLKLEHRTVVVLKHFQNLSYQEISYIIDVPEKTVKARLFTARERLKGILLRKGFSL
jgi:RNA polymerase sigma-70 factor (ECF subfamily)